VQVGLELWRDHKNRRAALRPVDDEISGIIALLVIGRDRPVSVSVLRQPEEWRKHRESLSRELPDRKWNRVVAAYAMYDTLRTLDSALEDSQTANARREVLALTSRTTIDMMDVAHRSLTRRRNRSTRRTSESLEDAVAKSRNAD
jgi:hypothetical protein